MCRLEAHLGRQSSPSMMWLLGIKLRLSGQQRPLSLLSHLTGPTIERHF